jgi:DNA-binding response OmpR family regulator
MTPAWDVLVVEDEAVVRDAIRLVLEHEGFRVAVARDGEIGLLHPALADCHVVFCDLMLPGRSGFEIIAEIRRRRPSVPLVAITGYPTPEIESRALAAGATAFLPKPFDAAELLEWMRRVLPRTAALGEERSS